MFCVIAALMPTAICGCFQFGLDAVMVLLATTGTAVLTEIIWQTLFGKQLTAPDGSAAVTGLILGLCLPPSFPVYWAAAGSAFAIIVVKQLFGGIGKNFANPALTAKTLLMLLFMQEMHTWTFPDGHTEVITETTELTQQKSFWDLMLGNTPGCIGHICAAGIILGGVFLILKGIISPAAPAAFIGSFALLSLIAGDSLTLRLLSGSLLFCAVFAATDYTTTPVTVTGKTVFGIGCGCLSYFISRYGGYADGSVLAVLIMNLFVPLIDRITAPRVFGSEIPRSGENQ